MQKDSEVEVSSEDEGFKDAWYRAILLENPTKSGRKKLQVRYTTLLNEDNSSLLTEPVEQRFIRPVPPQDPNEEFVEGSMVDADLKDGCWTGVVIKKLENDMFWVYFDSPPDVIEFEKKQLRFHFDWKFSKWVLPQNKELSKSEFRSGTFVEVNCKIDEVEDVWVPALIVKEIEEEDGEKSFIVKCCDKSLSFESIDVKPHVTVDLCNVRPLPPPLFVKEYELLDRVDAFTESGWRQGIVRWILANKRYKVGFEETKNELVFDYSDVRPSMEWEDGVWHQGPKRNSDKKSRKMAVVDIDTTLSESTSKLRIVQSSTADKRITRASSAKENAVKTPRRTPRRTKRKPSYVENTETDNEREVDTMVLPLAQVSENQMDDDVMDGIPMLASAPQVIPIDTEPGTQAKTSPGTTGEKIPTYLKMREYTRKRKRGQKHDSNLNEAGKACSKAPITDTSNDIYDDDHLPLSSWILGVISSTELSFAKTPNAVKTFVDDETQANEDTIMTGLPFVKQSPIWKVFETMEIFKKLKHRPHFIPLLETKEEFREGSAIGEMVKYSSLIERVENLQLDTPKSTLERLKQCFFELEKYGFDVTTPISRIDLLISLKDKQVNRVEELKDNVRQMTEEDMEKAKVEEELREVKRKVLELQSREADLIEEKEASEKKIAQMQESASALDKMIQDVELEFQSIALAPW